MQDAVLELYLRTNERLPHHRGRPQGHTAGGGVGAIRREGVATDIEEFTEGFCCIAAPVSDVKGAPIGALALSTTRLRFELHGDRLLDVAGRERLRRTVPSTPAPTEEPQATA